MRHVLSVLAALVGSTTAAVREDEGGPRPPRGQHRSSRVAAISLVLTALVSAASPARAYVTLAELEGVAAPIVWDEPVTVYLDHESVPTGRLDLFQTELPAAVQVWSSVACAQPGLSYGGMASAGAPVVVRWVEDWTTTGAAADAAGTTEVVLESGPSGGTRVVEATVFINGRFAWAAHSRRGARENSRDLRAVLVHELGHVLGLAHNCEVGDAARPCTDEHAAATMYPTYQGPGQGVLAPDDVDGLCALYPPMEPPPGECELSLDCPAGETCYGHDCWPDSAYGAPCEAGSECPGLACVETIAGGLCTHDCASPDDCPSGATCIETLGDRGPVCAPSSEYAGGCAITAQRPAVPWVLVVAAFFASRRRRNG